MHFTHETLNISQSLAFYQWMWNQLHYIASQSLIHNTALAKTCNRLYKVMYKYPAYHERISLRKKILTKHCVSCCKENNSLSFPAFDVLRSQQVEETVMHIHIFLHKNKKRNTKNTCDTQ